jgi:hypothetical protein
MKTRTTKQEEKRKGANWGDGVTRIGRRYERRNAFTLTSSRGEARMFARGAKFF